MATDNLLALSVNDLFDLVLESGVTSEVADKILEHGITGEIFSAMTEEEIKEVAPKIADRVALKKLRVDKPVSSTKVIHLEKQNCHDAFFFFFFLQESTVAVVENPAGPSPQVQNTQWHLSFEIPTKFSVSTEKRIKSGQLRKKNRTEIVQALSAAVILHTKYPTSEQYTAVCLKLIEKFPTLKDGMGTTGYVSCHARSAKTLIIRTCFSRVHGKPDFEIG